MPNPNRRIRVGVNGYGVIGKRVAGAVARQEDMSLVGVADVAGDWRLSVPAGRGIPLFYATEEGRRTMTGAGLDVAGGLDELLASVDVIVDCTPKGVGAENASRYRDAGVRFVLHGGEKHEVTGHSFVADANFETAVGLDATRVVSCNTTSVVRVLGLLERHELLDRGRGTLLRRATDPWESHLGGIMNTLVPERSVPSHQAPDARAVMPDLDVVTMAVEVPQTIGHLHFWYGDLTREADADEVLEAWAGNPRILLIRAADGLGALNAVKELALDAGRPHGDLYEVALWEDLVSTDGRELRFAYMVDNQAIVIPETIDAIRALAGADPDRASSMGRTNAALGIGELGPHTG